MKILLVGYNCAGKSFYSDKLSYALNVPLLHIDDVFYDFSKTPKIERSPDDVKKDVISFIDGNDSWVIDGGYDYTGLYECCNEADRILFMRINRIQRLINLYKRCKAHYDNLFIRAHRFFRSLPWMLRYGCGRKYDAENYSSLSSFPDKVTVLRTISDAQRCLYEVVSVRF